jgi:DNA-binding CsgD family transcriptional regulator
VQDYFVERMNSMPPTKGLKWRTNSVVYFIQSDLLKRIKIGRVRREAGLVSRFRTLQTGSPDILTILKVTSKYTETKLKDRFSSARLHGEWFSPEKELLEFIKRVPASKWDGKKAFSAFAPLPGGNANIRVISARIRKLTKREFEIIKLVSQGKRNKEISEQLSIATQTVKNHLQDSFEKLGISQRYELRHNSDWWMGLYRVLEPKNY